ncbi:MAG: hypothetical protein KTV77_01930 [Wolbachia endosymbiont of Fragariocoptes setiger]|nr:hypothetical protein [Wolbachia endosymbiont of Fragariocoptes setiger]
MSEGMGSNIAALQSSRDHQESSGEKSGCGMGFGDSFATVMDGMKWSFNWHEGIIGSYNNVLEGWISGGSLITSLGKQGNMLGIKILDDLINHFSDGGEAGAAPQDDGGGPSPDYGDSDNYPHFNEKMGNDFNDFSQGANDEGYYHGRSFDPGPSPSVGNDSNHGMSLGD